MSKNNKKTISATYMSKWATIFKCPVCKADMTIFELKSLVCSNRHTFDLARQGYINLTAYPTTTKYDKDLFESRRVIAESGFFAPLSKMIGELIQCRRHSGEGTIKILDAGCGEGSHLSSIREEINSHSTNEVVAVGVDISKEGVLVASKSYPGIVWCVADLANSPFKDNSFDVVLNILSPSNYAEFHRLLRDGGMVIKVVPQRNYLKELRDFFFADSDKQVYSNQGTVERFYANFKSVDRVPLRYSVTIDQSLLVPLIQMTPLSWSVPKERIQAFLKTNVTEITVELDILVATFHSELGNYP